MMTDDDTEEADGGVVRTALVLAAIGGGAFLIWRFLHGGGNGGGGQGKNGTGRGSRSEDGGGDPFRRVHVHVLPDDGIELNGAKTDLKTALAQARSADYVTFTARGDAVAGWVSRVYYALADAGVELALRPGDYPPERPLRFDGNGHPVGLPDLGAAAALSRFLDRERERPQPKPPSRQQGMP
jgi:hypothetical protein